LINGTDRRRDLAGAARVYSRDMVRKLDGNLLVADHPDIIAIQAYLGMTRDGASLGRCEHWPAMSQPLSARLIGMSRRSLFA
jgi:hypothetical protein